MNATERKVTASFPTDTEVQMTRVFDAPRDLVYDCFTNCEHLEKWWGWGLSNCEMDLRPGGAWTRTTKSPDGRDVVFKGVYKEVVRPEILSYSMIMGEAPEIFETIHFKEENGQTTITQVSKWPSKEMRDGAAPYMEPGANAAYNKLEALLQQLR